MGFEARVALCFFCLHLLVFRRSSLAQVSSLSMVDSDSSRPLAMLTPANLVVPGAVIPVALPIVGRVVKIVPGHARRNIESVTYSSDPRGHLPQYEANEIHTHATEKKVRDMLEHIPLLEKVEILISRRMDIALNPPIGYCSVYLD